ncbi:hypothetical protein QTI66_38020 [Variovorax sp. J22R133]|uniref:hypothetical protein n=1 Tax=Variovorax brevis TaxID=3053503 RepID=UPI0025757957|nr:hypothetical protein [Variovorax sp. J22R133]MDM0117889.1 hypothetical protein [Variovorax sp. J22R133]
MSSRLETNSRAAGIRFTFFYEKALGLRIGDHVLHPRAQLTPTALNEVMPPATAIRPYEKFVVPADLDGSAGRFRAPLERCLLMAANDYEAIGA